MPSSPLKASEVFAVGTHNIGYVSEYFKTHFGNEPVLPGIVLASHKLQRSMTDAEVLTQFSIQECSLGDVLATIDAATDDMKDGYWNIFYIKGSSRVVVVGWSDGEWGVCGWGRDGDTWSDGGRVFSPATDSLNRSPMPSDALTLESLAARIYSLEKWREGIQKA